MSNELRIGVVGYCPPSRFDKTEAMRMIREAYDKIDMQNPRLSKAVVSGLTNVGVPALAYKEAVQRGWRTIGIACEKANEYECFPVDEKTIIGIEWGDESQTFLKSIDILVRIGIGKQSVMESEGMKAKGKPVFEYDLPVLK